MTNKKTPFYSLKRVYIIFGQPASNNSANESKVAFSPEFGNIAALLAACDIFAKGFLSDFGVEFVFNLFK